MKINIPFLFTACLLLISGLNLAQARPPGRILQSTGDITLPPNSFTISDLFEIYFEFDNADIIMAIRCDKPGQYFSIGFGSELMMGSDMWVFQIENNAITAGDYMGVGHRPPNLDSKNDLVVLGYEINSAYSLVKVKRALDTGDSDDVPIYQGTMDLVYATGASPTMRFHGPSRGAIKAPLVPGVSGMVIEASTSTGAENVHAILNIVAWGLLVDIAVVAVRLLRGTQFRIGRIVISAQMIHSALMWIVFIMSTTVTATLLNRKGAKGITLTGNRGHDFHVINGLVMLGLSVISLTTGMSNFTIIKTPTKNAVTIRVQRFKLAHTVIGLTLYVFTKANIIVGCLFYDQGKWRIPVFIYLFVLLLVHLVLIKKYLDWKKYTNKAAAKPLMGGSLQKKHVALMTALNEGTAREKLLADFRGMKWVQLGNKVYDLTDWTHPGGNFVIEAVVGQEIGRYFYGNYALEGTGMKPHKHSALVLNQIEKFYVGEVHQLESILLMKESKEEAKSCHAKKWRIVGTRSVSETVNQIDFVSQDFNVKAYGSSFSWLGRHFKVSFDRNDSSARLYTTALALTDANTMLRENAYKYFTEIMEGNLEAEFSTDNTFQTAVDYLPLFMKKYPFKRAFSKAVHDVDISGKENNFRVEGPIGRGLEITPKTYGTHTIICAGTGILPFVDFLNMFLWKTMYQNIRIKAGIEQAKKMNVMNLPFDDYLNGMKVNFVGAFANEREILGLDIIKKLAEISNKYQINNFTAIINGYSDQHILGTNEFFTQEFLNKHVGLTEDKYYVVGPPMMNAQVHDGLVNLGVNKRKILLV